MADTKKLLERTQALAKFWEGRNEGLKEEREYIFQTQPTNVKPGFVNVVMNEPRVLWETSVALISGFDPRFKLPISKQGAEQKDKMNKAERWCSGVYREVDRRQLMLGREHWLKDLTWYIVGGWYSVFPWVDADADGNPVFHWDIFDPRTVYPWWSSDKLTEVSHAYYLDRKSAMLMAENNKWTVPKQETKTTEDTNALITSYYWLEKDVVWNCVWIDEDITKKPTQETIFGNEIPILIGPVGGSPVRVSDKEDKQWIRRMGQSVIATDRGMFDQLSRWISLLMQIVQDVAYPNVVDTTRSGQPKIKPEDMGSGKILHRQVGETVDVLKHASTPIEVNTILNILQQAVQRGGLPNVIYGSIPFELSGITVSQLLSAIRYKLSPYMFALQNVTSECAMRTMRMYKNGDFKPIDLMVEGLKGEHFIESFDPKSDMPDCRFIEVTIPFALPVDKNQVLVAARQALSNPPVLSRETIWESFDELGVEDKELEYQRIVDDSIMELPVVKLIHTIESLRERALAYQGAGKGEIAQKLNQYADMLEQQLQQEALKGPAPTATPPASGGTGTGAISPESVGQGRAQANLAKGERPANVREAEARRAEGGG